MPIQDAQLLFSESQDVSANAGASTDSTNEVYIPAVVDHTDTSRSDRPNTSGDLYLNAVVEDTAWVGNGAVITITLYHHTATGAVAGGAILMTAPLITLDANGLPDGTQLFSLALPQGIINPYLEVNVAVATANLTAAGFTCWIGSPIQQGGEHGAL
jgi:hypothetical protein